MRPCIVVIVLLMLVVGLSPASGQDSASPIRFSYLTTADGLSQEDVHVILRDPLGTCGSGRSSGG